MVGALQEIKSRSGVQFTGVMWELITKQDIHVQSSHSQVAPLSKQLLRYPSPTRLATPGPAISISLILVTPHAEVPALNSDHELIDLIDSCINPLQAILPVRMTQPKLLHLAHTFAHIASSNLLLS